METLYMITGILFLLVVFSLSIGKYRTYTAIKKVKSRPDAIKIQELNNAVTPFGYLYEHTRDIFVTTLHPWQRDMGYSRIYDESAISMSMVIQCEPVEFEYGGMLYLIEFWKGQYGMTTGAEVGIYKAEKTEDYKPGDIIFYQSILDKELLRMSMTLYKNGKPIVERTARHWWLTAFMLGEYSKPEELAMKIQTIFPNYGMLKAFVHALYDMGYSSQDVVVKGLRVVVFFTEPKSLQPDAKRKLLRHVAMKNNYFLCSCYQKLTGHFERTLDRIDYLRFRYHILAGIALRFSKCTKGAMSKSLKRKGKKKR